MIGVRVEHSPHLGGAEAKLHIYEWVSGVPKCTYVSTGGSTKLSGQEVDVGRGYCVYLSTTLWPGGGSEGNSSIRFRSSPAPTGTRVMDQQKMQKRDIHAKSLAYVLGPLLHYPLLQIVP